MASDAPAKYVKPKAAEVHFGVDRRTLRKWADAGHIRFFEGAGKHRLYDVSASGGAPTTNTTNSVTVGTDGVERVERVDAVYARVSTRKQLDDLDRQVATLKSAHPDAVVFTDCASGLNFKREGLLSLLQLAFEGRLRRVHVAHKDRLCRFAYDLVVHILTKHGAQVVVESQDMDPTFEQDLADDILSVVTVFGARLYGRRSGQGRKRKLAERQATEEKDDGADRAVDQPGANGDDDSSGSGSSD
jgi:putative resolvase